MRFALGCKLSRCYCYFEGFVFQLGQVSRLCLAKLGSLYA
jgi:hypothetical protein